jgi:hypothetical protein
MLDSMDDQIERERAAPGSNMARPGYRLHASTHVVLLLTAVVLFLLNVPGQYVPHVDMPLPEEQLFGDHRIVRERLEHGWPFSYLIRDDRYFVKRPGESEPRPTAIWSFTEDFVSFDPSRLTGDVLAALSVLAIVALLAEYWRRQRHAIWQLRISDLLGITAVIAGAIWFVQVTLREHEAERSAIQDLGLLVSDYSHYRRDPVSSPVSVRSHGGPTWLRSLLGERFPKVFDRLILLDDMPFATLQGDPERLAVFKSLRALEFVIAPPPMPQLERLPQLKQLEAIRIAVHPQGTLPPPDVLDRQLAESLSPLATLQKLWFVNASGQYIGDRTISAFAEIPRLRFLSLWGGALTDEGFAALARCKTLEELRLANIPLRDASLFHLQQLPRLRDLVLFTCSVAEADYDQLAQLAGLERLTIHDTDDYGYGLYKLAGHKRLKFLALSRHVDRQSVKKLQQLSPQLKIELGGEPFNADEW